MQTQEFSYQNSQSHSTAIPSMNCIACTLSYNQIFDFLYHCIRRLFPKYLLGSKKNWRAFAHNLRLFLTYFYQGMTLSAFLSNIKQSAISWLQVHHKPTAKDNQQSSLLLSSFMWFTIEQVIVFFISPMCNDSSFHFYQITFI